MKKSELTSNFNRKEKLFLLFLSGILISFLSALTVHYKECSLFLQFSRCGVVSGWPMGFAEYNPPTGIILKYFNPANRFRVPLFMGLPYGFKDWSWKDFLFNSIIWALILSMTRILLRNLPKQQQNE